MWYIRDLCLFCYAARVLMRLERLMPLGASIWRETTDKTDWLCLMSMLYIL